MFKNGIFRSGGIWLSVGTFAVVLLSSSFASAADDVAPAPHKSPRVPVNRQTLAEPPKAPLSSREVTGTATIIDGDHLRINNIDLRLFGIVPPQLSASFGPQARGVLDELVRSQAVNCHVRDRDHDGRFLATCSTAVSKTDLALELLKHGLAVTARGSLQPTELATSYEAAEAGAQTQKIGLWSMTVPPAAAAMPAPSVVARSESANVPPLPSELKKEEKAVAVEHPAPAVTSPSANVAPRAPAPVAYVAPAAATAIMPAVANEEELSGVAVFFARYQLLITGLVMLTTAFAILIALVAERRRDKRDEMKAIAAALRGELLAARAVCQARLKNWSEADEKGAAWPRIRATLYQAYVGRLGWLGAVLARQIASIYGQASDYSAYFNPNNPNSVDPRADSMTKRKALQTLVQHIGDVLPRLATIEQTGVRPRQIALPAPTPALALTNNSGGQDVTPYELAAPQETQTQNPAQPLWNMVRRFGPTRSGVQQEALPDYTTLIEEEMARMAEENEAQAPAPQQASNVTKIRSGT